MSNLPQINRAAVIGSGYLGTQIAMLAASTGYKEYLGFCLKRRFTQKRETIGQPIHKISYLDHGSVKNPGCEGQDFLIRPFLIQIVDRSGSQRRNGVD
jgi:hypothetical protein